LNFAQKINSNYYKCK